MDGPADPDVRTTAELTEATASGLRTMTYVRITVELVLLGTMVVLARLISPREFGIFAIVVIVQELAMTMPMEGIGSALVQRKQIERAHLQTGLTLSLLVGGALAAVSLVVAATVVVSVYGQRTASLIEMATPWYLICAVYALPVAVLRRRLDFRRLSLLDLVNSLVRSGAAITLAIAGLEAEALVLGNLAGTVACLLLALRFAPVPFPRWHTRAARDLMSYGGPAALACLAWTGFRNGDYAIIGARLGAAQAGFYWRGYQLAVEYQKKIGVLMTQMAFPVLARTTGDEAMLALRRRMVRLVCVVLFPLLSLLVLLAPAVVPWLFGPEWEPAVVPTQVLALGGAATLVIDAVGSALMAEGRARALLGFGVAHFAIYLGAVLAVASHGLVAVASAAAVVHSLFLGVGYWLLFRHREQHPLRELAQDLAAGCVGCVALLAAAGPAAWALYNADAAAPIEVLAVVPIGAVAYLLALDRWFPPVAEDLRAALRRIAPERVARLVPGGPRRAVAAHSAD